MGICIWVLSSVIAVRGHTVEHCTLSRDAGRARPEPVALMGVAQPSCERLTLDAIIHKPSRMSHQICISLSISIIAISAINNNNQHDTRDPPHT